MSHNKINIAFVVATPMTARSFLCDYFKKLNDNGFRVFLIANFKQVDPSFHIDHVTMVNIPIERNISLVYDIKALIMLCKILKEKEIEIVHSITPKAGLLTALAAKLANVKHSFHTFTGQVWVGFKGPKLFFFKSLDKLIYILNTECLVDSHSQKSFLIKNKIVSDRVVVLGKGSISGVDNIKFSPSFSVRSELRSELGIPSEAVVFLFLGRITEDKGVLDLVAAFELMSQENNAYLLLVGPNELRCNIPESKHNIRLVGFTDRPEIYMQASDVFCLPSYREGFGTVVIEAAACGIPALVSDIYGLKDAIEDNVTGVTHRVKCVEDIYEKLDSLALKPEFRLVLGENARKRAIKDFDMEDISMLLIDFYKSRLQHD